MNFEIELLPIKESKRFIVSIDFIAGIDYITGEPAEGVDIYYTELCYDKIVTLDRIKEYWDKVSDPDKTILEFCEKMKRETTIHPYTKEDELDIRYSNIPKVKQLLQEHPTFLENKKVAQSCYSLANLGQPYNAIEGTYNMSIVNDIFVDNIPSARVSGKASYLEARGKIAEKIKVA